MEPRIQYAQTADGVSIAYATLGEGRPLVFMPDTLYSHLQLDWQRPDQHRFFERLARGRKLVRFDFRGAGLSDREVSDYSLDALVADLETVVDRVGLDRFALIGSLHSGPVAIAYAARHPERVPSLVLWCTWARHSDLYRSPKLQEARTVREALMEKHWELFTETAAHALLGWEEGGRAHEYAAYMRECTTPDVARAALAAAREVDVTALLPQARSATLVLQRREIPWLEVDLARGLASRIPDARLALLEGREAAPFMGDMDAVLNAIDEFLGEGEETEEKTELPEGMAVILFADIVESTALTEEMGDAAFRAKARELDASLRAIIRETGGTPVEGKVLGDGVLAVFTSARQAIECALRCNAASDSVELQLHLGIHAGDVIREGNNVYGGAVNIAARIAGASAPGEVLVSDTVRGLARTSAGVGFEDRGEQTLKGIAEPQRLFAVRGGGA